MKKTQSRFVLVFVLALADLAVAQRPTITDFNPKVGPENSVVTITGTGFHQSNVNNVVLFGTKRATVLTSTTTQLTVAVPRGAMYEPLTVTNLSSNLIGYAVVPFRLTVRTRDSITVFSSTSLSIGAGRLVTAGDFNADANPDLSVSIPRIGPVDLVRTYQHASSSDTILFSQTLNEGIGVNVGPYSIEHGDFDADGRHDIVSIGQTTANRVITLLRNNSAATVVFDSVARYTTNSQIGTDLAVGDLNRDGKADIVVAVDNVPYVLAYRNTSTSAISFAAGVQLAGGMSHNSVAVGDVDRDGVHDLVVSYTDSNRVAVFRMVEGATFSFSYRRSFPVTTGQTPQEVRLGDYDADGDLDIAVSTSIGATKSITFLSNFSTSGNVSFGSPVSFTLPTASEVNSISFGDLNGDGRPDIAAAIQSSPSGSFAVLENRTTTQHTPSFTARGPYFVGPNPYNLAIADLNNDGLPEVAVAGGGYEEPTTQLRVVRNTTLKPTAIFFVNRTAVSFTTPINTTRVDSVIVTNTGGDTLRIFSASVRTTKFQVTPASATIAPGASRSFRITFIPLADTSLQRDTVTFLHNAPNTQDIVALSGRGTAPVYSINRTSITFTTPVGTPRTDSAIVTNTGTDTLRITSATLRNARYQVTPTSAAIVPGGARTFRITFTPTDTTLQRDTLRLVHNAAGSPSLVFLNGRGAAPAFSINRTNITFTTPVGTPRADSAIVTNTGTDTLRIASATLGNARYQVTPTSAAIAPGGARTFRITFTPTDTTLQRDTLRLLHNAVGSPSFVFLSGRGTAPVYTISRTTLAFTIPVNTSRTDSAIVTNTGSDTLRMTSATVSNPRFQAAPSVATIAPGASRAFRVTFIPGNDTTLQRDTLRLVHNATGSPSRVFLTGRGIAPALSLNRTSLAFITQINTSQTDSVVVGNPGGDTLRINFAGVGNPRFQVTPQTATIVPGGSRAFRVTFTPQSDTTLQRDTLRFFHNAPGSPTSVFLSGRGTPLPVAIFSLDRTSLSFSTLVNTSRTDSVRVTNTGSDTLRIGSTQLRNARFQVAPTSGNIAPGAARIFRVTFTPLTDTTLQRDTLRFFHNATGSPSAVTLNGQGVPVPVAVFSINRTTVAFVTTLNTSQTDSVIVGSVGTDTLRITSASGRNGRFLILPASAIIAPGTIRVFRITFSPGIDTTLQRDTMRLVHNAAGSPSQVVITGRGVPPSLPAFSINRTSLTFAIPINTSRSDSVVVSNPGTDTLRILSAAGSNFRFQVFPQVAAIAPGASRAFSVTFSSQQDTTLQRDTLRFQHNAAGSPHVMALSGRGLAPQFLVNRTVLAFNIPINTSRTDSVFVSNVGSDTLRIVSAFVRNARFAVAPQSAVLLPGRVQAFRVTFMPQSDTTLQRDTLTFVHNALGSPTTVALSGKGNPIPAPLFSINRNALTFNVPINSTRTDSVVVTNTGTDTLRILSALVANPRFQSTPSSASIMPGAARAFRVTFSPQSDTLLQSDTLRIQHNAAGSPVLVALAGRGIPPSLPFFQADSAAISFGRVVVSAFRDYAISIFNPGAGILRIDSVRSSSPVFRLIVADTATILPAGSRAFIVRFTPSRVGAENRVMRFYHNAPSGNDAIGMGGTGVLPAPTNLRVTDSTSTVGAIRLQWNPVSTSEGFLHYKVYGGTTQNPTTIIDSTLNARRDSVTRMISNLVVGARYYFRVTAMDSFRTEGAYSNELAQTVFVRSPEVITGTGAFDSISGRALLRGRANPFGATTVAWFEYDTIPLPSNSARTTTPRQLGNGIGQVLLEDTTSALLRGRQYHFRLVGQNSFSMPAFGVVQTFFVPQGTIVPPLPPELRVPPDNANVTSSVQMTWAQSAGASSYHLQVALEQNFSATTFYLINDSTLADSSRTLQPLAAASVYYWRVGAKNAATQSAMFSPTRRFETERNRDVQSPLLVFPQNPRSERDYRLVSIPGNNATLADLIADAGPTEGVDWRVFRDNGRGDTVGRQHLVPLVIPTTVLTQGEGYWLIRKHSVTIRRSAPMTPLDRDGAVAVTLHEGFNIVANPFELPVSWNAVRAKNPDLTNARLYQYTGAGYDTSAMLEPFAAYYVFKPAAVNALRVPYPFIRTSASPSAAPKDWQVQLEYRAGESEDKLNFIGVAPSATDALDALEHYEAPLTFNHGSLYFVRPEWDGAYKLFSDDFRPKLGDGQTWEFEVANPNLGHGVIEFRGLETVPAAYRVLLINRMNTVPIDLRTNARYEFVPTREQTQFTLVVGTPSFVDGIAAKFVPDKFALAQNYPNPFNPTTTISYAVARAAHVRIEIISALGARIRTLVNEVQEPASYTLNWDATADNAGAVASGVYFYRLIAGGNIVETRKMLLLR